MSQRGEMATWISSDAASAINRHAAEAYPHECCGALLGCASSIEAVLELANTTEEGPRRRFLVRPEDYRSAEAGASTRGLELLGFYHSHPDHPARPSDYDLAHAWPTFVYVIVAVAARVPGDMTCWRLREDRSTFDEVPLAIGGERRDLEGVSP